MGVNAYKIVAYEPGAANLIDRTSGERVGYLLQDFWGQWSGYVARGKNHGVKVVEGPYRREVAAELWHVAVERRA